MRRSICRCALKLTSVLQALLEPYVHIEQTQGKGMREKLIDAFNQWLKVDEDKLEVIKQIITKLHTASLL